MKGFRKTVLFLGDIFTLYLALAATILIRYPAADFSFYFNSHFHPFSIIFIIWIVIFYLSNFYQYKEFRNRTILIRRVAGAVVLSGAVSVIAFYLFGQFFNLTPKINLLIFSVTFLVLNCLWRILAINAFAAGGFKMMILGESPLLSEIESYLDKNPHAGYQIVSRIKRIEGNDFEPIAEEIKEKKIGIVVTQLDATKDSHTLKALFRLLPLEVDLENARDFYESIFEKVPLKDLEEDWFIEKISTRRPFYDAFKRLVDLVLSVTSSIIFLPFSLIIAFVIKATSAGPAIFKQKRVGKNGNFFTLYKFRTMYNENHGPLWTEEKDKRITPFGKFLRFTHLDEIPQLWNIAKGDISFTGPRPERVELAETFSKFPYYEIRHIIKPGLSGWAQINYKPSASLEEAYEKLCYDIYYVKNRSIFLDFTIIFKTIKYIFVSHF